MGHNPELIQSVLDLVQKDYPADLYSAVTEARVPGTRMYPDILISDCTGRHVCAVEIG